MKSQPDRRSAFEQRIDFQTLCFLWIAIAPPLPRIHKFMPVPAPQQSDKVRTRKLGPVSKRYPARIDRSVRPTRYSPMSNVASGLYLMASISLRSASGISRGFPRFLADHLLHAVANYAPAAHYNYRLYGLTHRTRRSLNIVYTERNIREAAPRPYDQEGPDAWIIRAELCNSTRCAQRPGQAGRVLGRGRQGNPSPTPGSAISRRG